MQPEWWQWAIVGIALILAELAIPVFVMIWFGLGALLVSVLVGFFPALGLTAQLGCWLALSLLLILLWFRIFRPGAHKTRIGMSDDYVIGEIGLLTHSVAPFEKGRVRFQKPILGSETWDCIADEAVAAGERVRVVGIEGSLVKVRKV
ncbi:MAG TPA: NfeD family protein [Rhodocyclaceae bacterium]|nr:NfeD family protein [Rhodocyclaceae bacterium]